MIDAGFPWCSAWKSSPASRRTRPLPRPWRGARSVEAGSTLANGLRLYPKIFDDLYTNMVEAGETGGILDTILAAPLGLH